MNDTQQTMLGLLEFACPMPCPEEKTGGICPAHSIYRKWLNRKIPFMRNGQIWRLESGFHGKGITTVVCLKGVRGRVPYGPDISIESWTAAVVGGNHPSYPPFSQDIVVTVADLDQRGTLVEL